MPSPSPVQDPHRTTVRQWAMVAVLSLSTFVVVTSEMLPVGVLTPMAAGLDVAPGVAGYSLTMTGLAAAVTAPVVPRILGTADRRLVLAAAMVTVAVANALTALSPGAGLLLVSRVILGVALGTAWGLAAAVAPRLVAPRDAALAVSCAVSAVAGALVVGVPLGTFMGNLLGWRAAFAVLAGAAVALAAGLAAMLPRLGRPSGPVEGGTTDSGRSLLGTPAVGVGLLVIGFLVTAHFAAYTYLRPVLEDRAGLSPGTIALVLLVYGVFALVGNFASGALAARRARTTVVSLAVGIGFAITLLAVFGGSGIAAGAAVAVWGLAYGGLSVAGQIWMSQAAPHRVEHVTGVYVGVFTAAIALGAFAGGTLVEATGTSTLLWGAAVLAFAALAVGLVCPDPNRSRAAKRSIDAPDAVTRPECETRT